MNYARSFAFAAVMLFALVWTTSCVAAADPLEGATVTIQTAEGSKSYRLEPAESATQPSSPVETPASLPTTKPAVENAPGKIGLILPSGMAPCVVHVNALGIKPRHGTILTARYKWNFGDAAGRFNELPGWNAAHIYDRAGQYGITLAMTDEAGEVSNYALKITVVANARRVIYVSSSTGDDANSGGDPTRPLKSIGKAFAGLRPDTAIVLKRGDVFDIKQTLEIKAGNVVIGAYGDANPNTPATTQAAGDRPVIRFGGEMKYIPMVRIDAKTSDVVIQDVAFDSTNTKNTEKTGMPHAIVPNGQNFAARNCAFLNIGDGINSGGKPHGVMAIDCIAPLPTGVRSYFAWIQGTDHVYLGNTVANSTREHNIRCGGGERILIYGNDLTNLDRRPADKTDTNKGCLTIRSGGYAYIAHNTLRKGQLLFGPLGNADGLKDPAARWVYGVAEDNTFLDSYVRIEHGASHLSLRNNFIRQNDWFAFEMLGFDEQYGRGNEDITIDHNTARNGGSRGGFVRLQARVDDLVVTGNTYAATKIAGQQDAAVIWVGPTLAKPFAKLADNVWPANSVFWMTKPISTDEFFSHIEGKRDQLRDVVVPTEPGK